MSWTVDYEDGSRSVRLTFHGDTTGRDLREATSATILKGRSHGTRAFLIDARDIHLSASAFSILSLPDKQYAAEGADRRSQVAVLMPGNPTEQANVQFYETVCLNRGWQVRCFSSPDEADAWLASAAGESLS